MWAAVAAPLGGFVLVDAPNATAEIASAPTRAETTPQVNILLIRLSLLRSKLQIPPIY
jgi:hypothetical protein